MKLIILTLAAVIMGGAALALAQEDSSPAPDASPEASVMKHDMSVAQAYVADDFRGISSKGKVMNKSDLMAELKKDTDTYTSTKTSKVDVRVFGGQFAVATGISIEEGKAKDGTAFKRSFRWTDAWVERNGKWQCVASQAMLVPK